MRALALVVALFLVASACSSTGLDDPDSAVPPATPGADAGGPGDDGDAAPPPSQPTTSAEAGDGAVGDDGVAGAPGLGDEFFPELGNGGYDVERYVLALAYDPAEGILDATATIEATATERLDTFNLDFIGYDITALTVDGADAPFTRDDAELIVDPDAPLAAGADFVVTVDYVGEPAPVDDPSSPIVIGWLAVGSGSFVVSEVSGSRGWFPANDHPLDKARFRFEVTTPDAYTVAANGLLVDRSSADGQTTWIYEARDPMATYLSTVAIGDYLLTEEEGPGGVLIRNAFHTSLADAAEFDFGRTDEMLELFTEQFGPYPFEAYGVIVVDVPFGAALETQTFSVFSADIVTGDRLFEDIVAHELAHQWFGDYVALEQWGETWLKEGIASYAEMLWSEHAEPGYDIDRAARALANQGFPPPGNPSIDELYGAGVYLRGALTFHALRRTVGDDDFFAILRTYVERFANANASTDDLIAVAEEVSGEQLDDLFDAWLFDERTPPLPG